MTGGFQSSNLYGSYIIYLSFIEVARRRFWNLVPALMIIYVVGSKACYMASLVLLAYAVFCFFESKGKLVTFTSYISRYRLPSRFNFYWPLAISGLAVVIFTQVMIRTDYFINWSKSMESSKADTTRNNMLMYGLSKEKNAEPEREKLLKKIEGQYVDNHISLTAPPLITDVGMSVGLRVTQYDYIFKNILRYFFVGDTIESQGQMFGHNPHSAIPDFISRLGLLYLIVVLIFYARLFKAMNLLFFNVGILPILAFQPYGFTIGHSIVILSLTYALTKTARQQNAIAGAENF